MEYVRWSIIVVALLFASCGPIGDPPAKDKAKAGDKAKARASDPQELDRLKGTWQVVGIQTAGKNVPDDRVQEINLQYLFQAERATIWYLSGSSFLTTFSVDATASPKRMIIGGGESRGYYSGRTRHVLPREATNRSPDIKAIYSFEGNKLQICLMMDENPNAGYPTELVSQASPETDLLTLERR